MLVDQFINNLKAVSDPTLVQILRYQKTNPIDEPEKFKAYRKGTFNAVAYIKPILNTYILSTCSGKAFQKYPNNVIKRIQYDLELRKQVIPKIVQILKKLKIDIPQRDICKMACKLDVNCVKDSQNSSECKKNFCRECV